jgi:hypothetical protein
MPAGRCIDFRAGAGGAQNRLPAAVEGATPPAWRTLAVLILRYHRASQPAVDPGSGHGRAPWCRMTRSFETAWTETPSCNRLRGRRAGKVAKACHPLTGLRRRKSEVDLASTPAWASPYIQAHR